MDVEPRRGVLLVREGRGGRDRFVPVGERAASWLERWLSLRPRYVVPPDVGWLFLTERGRRLTPKRLGSPVRSYVEAAGVAKTGSCHLFRHTMATRVSIAKLQDVHRRTHRARRTEADHDSLVMRARPRARPAGPAHEPIAPTG